MFVLYHSTPEGVYIMALDEDADELKRSVADLEAELNDDGETEPADLEWQSEDREAPGSGTRHDIEVCQPPWFAREFYYALQEVR